MLKEAWFSCAAEPTCLKIHGPMPPESGVEAVSFGKDKEPKKAGTYVRFSVDFLPAVWYNKYQYKSVCGVENNGNTLFSD